MAPSNKKRVVKAEEKKVEKQEKQKKVVPEKKPTTEKDIKIEKAIESAEKEK